MRKLVSATLAAQDDRASNAGELKYNREIPVCMPDGTWRFRKIDLERRIVSRINKAAFDNEQVE